jgi:hypothetical protein
MSTRFTPPPVERLGLGGIMRATLMLYRAAPGVFLAVSLVTTIPATLLVIGTDLFSGTPHGRGAVLAQQFLPAIPVLLLQQLSIAATAVIVMHMFHGLSGRAGTGLERVGERFWILAAVVAITSIGIVAGLAALIIPGIWLLVIWLYAPLVTVTEHRGIRASLTRSAELVRGRFWWTLGSVLAIQLTATLGALVISDAISLPLVLVGGTLGAVLRALALFVGLTLAMPVANLGMTMIYMELRVQETPMWPVPPMRWSGTGD